MSKVFCLLPFAFLPPTSKPDKAPYAGELRGYSLLFAEAHQAKASHFIIRKASSPFFIASRISSYSRLNVMRESVSLPITVASLVGFSKSVSSF